MEILIIGGGYAGMACATRLARRMRRDGTSAQVRLVCPDPVLIERIRLHQRAAGQSLPVRRIDRLLQRAGVAWVRGCARAIDLQARTVQVGECVLHWDRLVLALGSKAGSRDVPGMRSQVYDLEALSARALAQRLQRLPSGARVRVVGGGLTGIEAATEVAERHPHLNVSILSRRHVAEGFGVPAQAYLHKVLRAMRIEVHEGVDVKRVEPQRLSTSTGPMVFDVCLWAAGFRLSELPRQAGLAVNAQGQVLVDPQLRSISHPAVYAAGDIAAPVLDPGHALPMGCKAALPAGAHVGENLARELAGRGLAAFDFAVTFFCVSLGRRAGLIQWPDARGRLGGRILTGRIGAWIKELVCRSTWWSLVWESRGWPGVVWKRTGHAPEGLAQAGLAGAGS